MAPYLLGPASESAEESFAGFPVPKHPETSQTKKIKRAGDWTGSDLQDESSYVYRLSSKEHDEIRAALRGFLDCGLDGHKVRSDNFLLPALGPRLAYLARDLHEGKGIFVIRGLNPGDYSHEDNLLIFLGISSYIGSKRGKQTDDGSVFGHLHNPARMETTQKSRPLKYSNRVAEFHNDIGCDILAIQTRCSAKSGGDSVYAAAATVFDHISRYRPDLAKELLSPAWPFDIGRRWSASESRPMVFQQDGRIITTVLPDALYGLTDVLRPDGLPSLTPKQHEALDLVQRVAQTHQLRVATQPGDLTFVNNWAVLHGREAFEDCPEQRRYHVRMWLKNEDMAWELPEALRLANRMVFHDESLPEKWNLYPENDIKFQVYERQTP